MTKLWKASWQAPFSSKEKNKNQKKFLYKEIVYKQKFKFPHSLECKDLFFEKDRNALNTNILKKIFKDINF